MNEKQTNESKIRPTKKQLILLKFIEEFIGQHGYSPSYREIMVGLNYTSVATVALHVNSLIARGQLVKRGRSARSLELAEPTSEHKLATNQIKPGEEKWLVEKVEHFFNQIKQNPVVSEQEISQMQILIDALKILNLEGAAHSFSTRLADLKNNLGLN